MWKSNTMKPMTMVEIALKHEKTILNEKKIELFPVRCDRSSHRMISFLLTKPHSNWNSLSSFRRRIGSRNVLIISFKFALLRNKPGKEDKVLTFQVLMVMVFNVDDAFSNDGTNVFGCCGLSMNTSKWRKRCQAGKHSATVWSELSSFRSENSRLSTAWNWAAVLMISSLDTVSS